MNILKRLLSTAILATTLVTSSCGGKTPRPYLVNPPTVGTVEPWVVVVQNNTQWNLNLGYATSVTTGQSGYVIIPPGAHATFDIGFLPASVTVTATTTHVPFYTYPSQTQTFGVDYGPYSTGIGFGFP